MSDCIFCKIVKREIPSDIIYENNDFFSIFVAYPQVEGHTLVISKKHFGNILDLPVILAPELLDCIKETSLILMKKYKAGGFNLVNNNFEVAGQVVPHFHFHIFPRRKGDGELKFIS